MKALLTLLAVASSTPAFAGSVCTMTIGGICGSTTTVNCDGKDLPAYNWENCSKNDAAKVTSTLKKLLDQDYKLISHVAISNDGGQVYTLTK